MELPILWPVACHTKNVGKGSAFVAIKGQNLDGIDFILDALACGAKKIVITSGADVSLECRQAIDEARAELIFVENARHTLSQLSAQAYDWPAKKLKIIAITGTKGKTTTACLVYHMLRTAGYSTALISSIYNKINDFSFDAALTTPQPDYLHMFLGQCVEQGVQYVVMEVAAQAVSLHRVYDIMFDAVIFTNFGHEHSEFYATFDDYFNAKVAVLHQTKQNAPLFINADDARVQSLKGLFKCAYLFSIKNKKVDFFVEIDATQKMLAGIIMHADEKVQFECPALLGDFNGANIIAAAGFAYNLGVSFEAIAKACKEMPHLPGRLERYMLKNGTEYIIDYAHTPESYERVLELLRSKTDRLTVIFGAGGARDITKRPIMGAIAARYADHIFLTTDNPRMDDPACIVEDIFAGIPIEQKNKVIIELDREKAIKMSYQLHNGGGIIALLGKGPDEYQLIKGVKIPFSEKAIIQQLEV